VKRLNVFVALSAVAAVCASAPAHAARVGVWIGPGWGYYYPVVPAPYYYPPVVAVPAPPQEYVEQGQADGGQAQSQSNGSWYYCDASKAYYPYVKQCTAGWREVPARPGPSN